MTDNEEKVFNILLNPNEQRSPTLRRIAVLCELHDSGSALFVLRNLEKKGFIEKKENGGYKMIKFLNNNAFDTSSTSYS